MMTRTASLKAGLLLGAALALTSAGRAQNYPCPTPPKPYAPLLRDVSRNIMNVSAKPGITYFGICQATKETVRYTARQPFHMELVVPTGCDELNQLPLVLDGYYYSQIRMNDPASPNVLNPRIGWHNGWANVKNPTTGATIGYATFEGTIGTNTSRAPLPEGNPQYPCYVCGHHTGMMRITFTQTATAPNYLGVIRAFYQFDAIYPNPTGLACDNLDQCTTDFVAPENGTFDGIDTQVCH